MIPFLHICFFPSEAVDLFPSKKCSKFRSFGTGNSWLVSNAWKFWQLDFLVSYIDRFSVPTKQASLLRVGHGTVILADFFWCEGGCPKVIHDYSLLLGDESFHEKPNGEKLICFLMFLLRLIICWLYDAIWCTVSGYWKEAAPHDRVVLTQQQSMDTIELHKLLQEDAVGSLNCCFKEAFESVRPQHSSEA